MKKIFLSLIFVFITVQSFALTVNEKIMLRKAIADGKFGPVTEELLTGLEQTPDDQLKPILIEFKAELEAKIQSNIASMQADIELKQAELLELQAIQIVE